MCTMTALFLCLFALQKSTVARYIKRVCVLYFGSVLWLCAALTCFQVVLVDLWRSVAPAQRLLHLVGVLHHVLQLVLEILQHK